VFLAKILYGIAFHRIMQEFETNAPIEKGAVSGFFYTRIDAKPSKI
jgi:hypothetical protein